MFMNTLIHFLEGTTLVLVGLLIAQVSRCYLNFVRMEQAQESLAESNCTRTMSIRVNISSTDNCSPAPKINVKTDELALKELAPKEEPTVNTLETSIQPKSSESTSNDQILNDYIGEFFSEAVSPDIQAFKHFSVESQASEVEELPSVEPESDEIIIVESRSTISPVIIDESGFEDEDLPVLTEIATSSLEDDSIITVAPANTGHQPSENVMSDKVVHAMLDEARLVCAS